MSGGEGEREDWSGGMARRGLFDLCDSCALGEQFRRSESEPPHVDSYEVDLDGAERFGVRQFCGSVWRVGSPKAAEGRRSPKPGGTINGSVV